jgi:hypothetical protein
MIVGGLVFRDSFGLAAAGTGEMLGYWPAAADVTATDAGTWAKRPTPPIPPQPPRDTWATPPVPPTPPAPPHGHRGRRGGVSVSIHGNRIQIHGIHELVTEHLAVVREMLRNNPHLPKDVRDKIVARMDRVKNIVDSRLKNLKTTDIDKLDDQLEQMGEELEKALEGLDKDLGNLGDRIAQDVARQIGKDLLKDFAKQKFKFDFNHDDDDNDHDSNNSDDDDDDADDDNDSASSDDDEDVTVAIGDLKDFALKPAQRDAIARLRDESAARVAAVERQLEEASQRLETALADPRTSDADVVRLVDQISGHEAAIRKARLLAWVQARRVLDKDQVEKLETATRPK